ncbi:MAG: hypothetical protein U9Q80_05000 [Bacillota bacterium]|nr:hypothetical protein [Bacillota bacterium]
MYYSNNFGCLIVFVIFFALFLFASRLLFTTPLGLVFAAYLIYRWYIGNKKAAVNSDSEPTENYNNDNNDNNNNGDFFKENEEVIDVDYEDIDD